MDNEEFLTARDVARLIKRSYRSVIRLFEEGKIEYYRPTPRTYLTTKAFLYAYLEKTKNL